MEQQNNMSMTGKLDFFRCWLQKSRLEFCARDCNGLLRVRWEGEQGFSLEESWRLRKQNDKEKGTIADVFLLGVAN